MISTETLLIENAPTYEDGASFLLTKFNSNKKRINERFFKPLKTFLLMHNYENPQEVISFYSKLCEDVKPFTFEEAFAISENNFRASVFSIINVPEMIKHLGHERIVSDGIELTNRTFKNGVFTNEVFHQVYELHKVFGEKLNLDDNLFVIKCWCTSTDSEHWLWVDEMEGLKNDPLSAIASTCKIYKSMVGKIKHIIRQGDVFLFEMLEEVIPQENEEQIPMNKKDYFQLLKSQS